MSTEDNKANVHRAIEEGLNQGKVTVLMSYAPPTSSSMILPGPTFAPSKTSNDGSPRAAAPSPTSISRLTT